jgi:hypothetical protein
MNLTNLHTDWFITIEAKVEALHHYVFLKIKNKIYM